MHTTHPHTHERTHAIFSNPTHRAPLASRILAHILASLPMAACATSGSPPSDSPVAAVPTTLDTSDPRLRALPAFDGHTSERISWSTIVDRCTSSEAVLIGEVHGHDTGLATAAALWADILDRQTGSPALALEFFERDDQVHLDDYLSAITTEEQFTTAAARTPGNYPPGHRAMVQAARDAEAPVIAANAPRRYVRLARTDSLERLFQLTSEQQRLLAVPDALSTGPYRDRFFALMGEMMHAHSSPESDEPTDPHAHSEPELDPETEAMILAFYRAQNVWDATMADSVARAVREGYAPVLLVVGQFHTDFQGGTRTRLRDRDISPVVVISMVASDRDSLSTEDRDRANIVIYTGAPDD